MSSTGDKRVRRRRRRRVRWWRLVLLLAFLLLFVLGAFGVGFVVSAVRAMPSIDSLRPSPALTSVIYDRYGRPAVDIPAIENRLPVDIDKVPKHVQDAFVAIEDSRFWTHHGIDLYGIARAALQDVLHGNRSQGASTITQQLARNAFPIGRERTFERKVQEAILAIELERTMTKKEILEAYLTWINLGEGAYGIEAAARTYFGKPAAELTLAEGALLAALPKAPSAYDPFLHPEAALARRNLVLDRMAELGFITKAEAEAAKAEPLGVKPPAERPSQGDYKYPYFTDYVIDQLEALGFTDRQIFNGGLHVYTTLDPKVQEAIESAVADDFAALAKSDKRFALDADPRLEVAAVILDQKTGEILGMVGGRVHDKARTLNRVWQARHQPGSAIKPLAVYTPAFAVGYTPATVVDDRPWVISQPGQKPWIPVNDPPGYQGLTTIREAVRRSVNAVAAETLQMIGVDTGFEYAQKLGLTSLDPKRDKVPSLALGGLTHGVTPLEMARAYATLANGGVRTDPIAILKVTDSEGHVLKDGSGRPAEYSTTYTPVVSPEVAYLMTDVLRSVPDAYPSATGWLQNWSTAPRAHIDGWQVAGKTGTTDDQKAVWFAGYTPVYTGVVWVGYDEERRMAGSSGGRWAAPIWHDMMARALAGVKPVPFTVPDDIVHRVVDIKSGKLASPLTPPAFQRVETFIRGTEPTEVSDAWEEVQVTPTDPPMRWSWGCPYPPVTKVFLKRPPLGFDEVKPIAQLKYGSAYTDEKALAMIPADMSLVAPEKVCGLGVLPPGASEAASEPGGPPGSEGAPPPPITIPVRVKSGQLLSPSAIDARVGQEVTLVFQNGDDAIEHEIAIEDWGVDVKVPAGGTATVTVVPKEPGNPIMRCIEPGHSREEARWFVTR
ncbi:MAG: PBP1A family penicillin-binding protein [Clostridia bacterium]|nr:PBP1A family penicillin-binding protein [Clostridia bacterium]